MTEDSDTLINLSLQKIYPANRDILSLGLNFHLKSRHDSLTKNIDLEKLYKQITNDTGRSNIHINDGERLR